MMHMRRHPGIELFKPLLTLVPDFGMFLHYGVLVNGEGKEKICVKVQYVGGQQRIWYCLNDDKFVTRDCSGAGFS
jgi:hypothetical protein